jgi:hypothetical protein
MCKPLIKRVPADWIGGGFHGIAGRAPYPIDRELFMLHLKYYDIAALEKVAKHRHTLYQTAGRGHSKSAWALDADDLTARLRSWVTPSKEGDVPEFDPNEPDLTNVVRGAEANFFRTRGRQLRSMERSPLRQLPERFHTAL